MRRYGYKSASSRFGLNLRGIGSGTGGKAYEEDKDELACIEEVVGMVMDDIAASLAGVLLKFRDGY